MAVDPSRSAGDPHQRAAGARTAHLFEQHKRMVYGLCRTLLRDPDDADDATQATFTAAYTALLRGGHVREPAAWLATIARNECGASARMRMREPLPFGSEEIGHVNGPEASFDQKLTVESLQRAIAELPEKQREAVVLRDIYGLPYREVGDALGISVASVESLLFRARRSLRVSLKPLATGALTVPAAVREGIAQALPGFPSSGTTGGGVVSGAIGAGLLAKFAGGPVAVKIAAGVAAVAVTGSVAVGVKEASTHDGTAPGIATSQVQRVVVADRGSATVAAMASPSSSGTRSSSSDDHGSDSPAVRESDAPGPDGEAIDRSSDEGDTSKTHEGDHAGEHAVVPDAPDPVEASEPGATDRQEAVASSDRPEDALSGGVGLERSVHGSTSADSSSEPMSDDAHLDDPNPIEPLEVSGSGEPLPEIADPSPTGG